MIAVNNYVPQSGLILMRRAAVILRNMMMAPCFSCIMGGVVTAPVEISMPSGRREIVPLRFGANVNGWVDGLVLLSI